MTEHKPQPFYENADNCPHGPEPDDIADPASWDEWSERHPTYDDGRLCLDKPAGLGCQECSDEHAEMVPWSDCRVRTRTLPAGGIVPNPDADHQPVAVWVGGRDCFERECDDYFDDDGNELPAVDRCSHIREDTACSCQRQDDGEYGSQPCTAAS